jgi:threonine/homoserine/homoserine lactone efflux protein
MVALAFLGLVGTLLLTPGPTNTLLAMAGAQQGLRRSWPLIPAEALGYVLAISVWGWLLSHLLDQLPWAVRVLRLLCALYLIRVALRLWRSPPPQSADRLSPAVLLLTTLFNPKAFLFASLIFPAACWQDTGVYLAHLGAFLGLLGPIALLWISVGTLLERLSGRHLGPSAIPRTASVVLVGFAGWMLLAALRG